MNDLLQETMREHAEDARRPRLDLDSVMAAGERHRKRRGGVVAGAVAAVCAATVFGVVQVSGGTSDDGSEPGYSGSGTGAFQERKVTYALGSTIHYGADAIDVGDHEIRSFVQTDAGFVFAEKNGTVYLADGDSVREIGAGDADGRYLKADDTGSYVAWVDSDTGDLPEFVVYDTAAMEEIVRTSEGNRSGMGTLRYERDPAIAFAVDGDGAYVLNGKGLARIDIGSGDSELLRRGVEDGFEIPDVASGRILRDLNRAHSDVGSGEVPLGSVLSRDPNAHQPRTVADARDLSPDAGYVTTAYNDSEQVFDTRTNEEIRLETESHDFQAISQWVDNDTVVVMALDGPNNDPTISLSRCELPSGACDPVVEGLGFGLQLPVGEHIDAD